MSDDREHRLELSLRNCLALARRMQSKDPDAWGHIIRFCREAGIEPNILRDAEPDADALEARAAEIYDGLEYDGPGEKPSWMPGGNSFKQDAARTIARLEANDAKVAEAAVMSAFAEARRHLPPGALAKAILQSREVTPRTVVGDLVRHMDAIRKLIDAARESESNPAWPGARRCIEVARALELARLAGESQPIEIESDVDTAERALKSISALLDVPLEAK